MIHPYLLCHGFLKVEIESANTCTSLTQPVRDCVAQVQVSSPILTNIQKISVNSRRLADQNRRYQHFEKTIPPVPCQVCGKPGHKERSCSLYNRYRVPYKKHPQAQLLEGCFHCHPAICFQRVVAGLRDPAHFRYFPIWFPISILSGLGTVSAKECLL